MPDLSTTYMGIPLRNPIIVGSSGLTDRVDSIKKLEKQGAGAVVLKSLFEEEIISEMKANLKKMASDSFLYPETLDFYEQQPHQKDSTDHYLDLITESKKAVSIPVIASINCITAQQWTFFPKQIEAAGADGMELNLFILPSDINRSAKDNERVYFEIIFDVLKQINIPVAIKISPYFTDLANMILRFSETGVAGIVLFNRFYNPDFDLDKLEVTQGNILSTPYDLPLSLRWISIMYNRIKCDLAASTGIHDSSAIIKQILAGASAVQVVSALYNEGIDKLTNMVEGLETWMMGKGFYSIDDFKGKMSQDNSDDPAAYERVQFMKYFKGYKP